MIINTLHWDGDLEGHCMLIDQCLLPDQEIEIPIQNVDEMILAIKRLAVRGAPAIGVAAAYGICLSTKGMSDAKAIREQLEVDAKKIAASRPTAVNLHHMVDRMSELFRSSKLEGLELRQQLLEEAICIHNEDKELCQSIGNNGQAIIEDGDCILTHCNAGALATGGMGTALSVFYAAKAAGKKFSVFADETRPLLQGARLTAWELQKAGIDVTLICDNAAAHFFQKGKITKVVTGADRVAANGDAANKIGTYGVACFAQKHDVPFYIAAPSTTFDFTLESGDLIPIEERDADEVWKISSNGALPEGISVRNPAFDVTPNSMIKGWITEKAILQPPFNEIRNNQGSST